MKIKQLFIIVVVLSLLVPLGYFMPKSLAQADASDAEDLKNKITKYEKKVAELAGREVSLANEIAYVDSQVALTELRIQNSTGKIAKTQQDIEQLAGDIESLKGLIAKLEMSMDHQRGVLAERIRERYKTMDASPILMFFGSATFDQLIQKSEYLRVMELQDNKLIIEMTANKNKSTTQKNLFEDKKADQESLKSRLLAEKAQLDSFKSDLAQQKAVKKKLLENTQNDEAKYQQLLAQARAEYEAIQGILNGSGIEDAGTPVKVGQKVASVISGGSCNSFGSHLHFMIKSDGVAQNPFDYLKSGVSYVNCSGSSCGSSDGDPFNPHGKWPWPLQGKIKMSQGFGYTWATRYPRISGVFYRYHDGLDILGDSLSVYAVQDGTYYRGTYTGGNGCALRYVRLDHKNGVQSYYLHVNY